MNKSHLTILSFGAGQDSTALLFMYLYDEDFRKRYAPNGFAVVFSDTMDEHPHTYKYLRKIQRLCIEKGIPFFWLTPDQGYHAPSWQGLMEKLHLNDSIFGKGMNRSSCTVGLKIDPIYKFLAHYVNEEYMYGMSRAHGKVSLKEFADRYGRIDVLIGFAAGENRHDPNWREKKDNEGEFVAPFWMRHSINKVHPLVEMNMDRKACQEKIRSYGHEVPYPSNCMRCFWASKKELLWLYRNYPGVVKE